MGPLQPHFDPWTDTNEERGQERDDPFDGWARGPFGTLSETVGVPNLTRGGRSKPALESQSRLSRRVILGVIALVILISAISAYVSLF